ncbi:MAG: phosphate/phosphite/phosphonate ABC transporter substrate-binding protein [Gammaproteobacteria bacterium]|nr:phosphate/phosphite/phosphonate ABC transporter substrate-binding protein [Gammaproteobacteria bacterium]
MKRAPWGWKASLVGMLLGLMPGIQGVSAAAPTFLVGVVPQYEVSELHQIWGALLNRLGERLGVNFKLIGSPSIPAFEQSLASGAFDFAYLNPYDMVVAHRLAGYEPLLRDISNNLHGVLVVRKESPIRSVAELDHEPVAFPAPNALGASLLMRAELQDRFGVTVQPRYVKTHDSVYLNVVLGEVVAGGGVLRTLDRQSTPIRDALRILHTTNAVPSHPIAVHPRVPEVWRQRVVKSLLAMAEGGADRKLLLSVPMQEPGPAIYADYQPLEAMGLERFYVSPK